MTSFQSYRLAFWHSKWLRVVDWFVVRFTNPFTLGTISDSGDPKPFKTVRRRTCARCGCVVTKENDSGWQDFVSENTTQPRCKACDSRCQVCGKPLVFKHWHSSSTGPFPEYHGCCPIQVADP